MKSHSVIQVVASTSEHFQELFTYFILFLDNMKKSPCAAASLSGLSFAIILSSLLFHLNHVLVPPLLAVCPQSCCPVPALSPLPLNSLL